jgi:hypothetical protein
MNRKIEGDTHSLVSKPRNCDGCGVKLQFFEEKAIGYVDYKVYKTFIENEVALEENKKKSVEELVYNKVLLNQHVKLPSKKEIRVREIKAL